MREQINDVEIERNVKVLLVYTSTDCRTLCSSFSEITASLEPSTTCDQPDVRVRVCNVNPDSR